MPNPLIAQGTLSRIRASVTVPSFPALNVTSSFLGKEGIRLTLQGESVLYLPTMVGAVTSPEPYMLAECIINLLKPQSLANQYKQQMESNALINDITIRSDAAALGVYQLVNCSIKSIRELDFSGRSELFAVTLGGYYILNQDLFA